MKTDPLFLCILSDETKKKKTKKKKSFYLATKYITQFIKCFPLIIVTSFDTLQVILHVTLIAEKNFQLLRKLWDGSKSLP